MSQAVATYRFEAAQAGDLSFEPGDQILVLQQSENGWWLGRSADGREGVFPFNRVQIMGQGKPPPMPRQVIDRINRVQVSPLQPITSSIGQQYTVELILSNGQPVVGTKTMKHFRVLNNALNTLGGYQSGIGPVSKLAPDDSAVIPEWADNIKLSSTIVKYHIKERATILSSYLNDATGSPNMDYLIVYWCDPNASFSMEDSEKRRIADIHRQSQSTIDQKMSPRDPELARAVYAWVKRDDQEISFQKNEVVAVNRETQFTGWWNGEKFNGGRGLFPYNYVNVLVPAEASAILHPEMGGSSIQKMNSLPAPPKAHTLEPLNGGLGTSEDKNKYNTVGHGFVPVNSFEQSGPRSRKRVEKYSLCSTEAFDELLQLGVTIEENGQLMRTQGGKDSPKRGDTVTLLYSGYLWSPQRQELLEFASSDPLLSSKGKEPDAAPLEFTVGKNEAIDGIEEAVQRMKQGQAVRVTLTPDKAYGDVGYLPDIPGNSYLVYDLTLREIKRNQTSMAPNMQGVQRSAVQTRQIDEQFKGFMGSNSMRQISQSKRDMYNENRKNRVQNFGATSNVGAGVDSETFKKKLSLEKLQDIVRRKQYMEYGINPGVIEEYLTDADFNRAFEVDHFTWLLMPAFKRKQLKQNAKLV